MNTVELVVFLLDNQEYGIDISCAQEIIRIPKQITKIPSVPSYVVGMFNLRGKVISIIDLKKRFNENSGCEHGDDCRLLILDLKDTMLGVIVDDVLEVLKVDNTMLEGVCSEVVGISKNNINNVCKIDDRLILMLDAVKMKEDIFNTRGDIV